MTTIKQTVVDPQTAKVGDIYPRNGYEVQYKVPGPQAVWRRCAGKLNKTVEEARDAIKAERKPNPTLDIMIGRGPTLLYRIVKVTASIEIVEEVK